MTPNCQNCRFSAGPDHDLKCRRHAPVAQLKVTTDSYGDAKPLWPSVQAVWWCGDHELRSEPTRAA